MVEFYVASNFVLQWRRWMTASYTARWLLQLDALQAGARRPHRRQPRPAYLAGRRRLPQRRRGTGANSGNIGIYNYSITMISSATNLVAFSIILWRSVEADERPVRHRHSRASVLGGDDLRGVRHRDHAADRQPADGALFPAAGGRGEFPFRSRAHPRIWRADRAAEGRGSRDRPCRRGVRGRLRHDPEHHPRCACG